MSSRSTSGRRAQAAEDTAPSSLPFCLTSRKRCNKKTKQMISSVKGKENTKWISLATIWSNSYIVTHGLCLFLISGLDIWTEEDRLNLLNSPGFLNALQIRLALSIQRRLKCATNKLRPAKIPSLPAGPASPALPCLLGMFNISSVMLKSSVVCCCPL